MDEKYIILALYCSVEVKKLTQHDLIRKKFQKVRKFKTVTSAMSYMSAGAVKIPDTQVHITHQANISVLETFMVGTAENLKNMENYEACKLIVEAMDLRKKYEFEKPVEYYGGLDPEQYKDFNYKLEGRRKPLPYTPYDIPIPKIDKKYTFESKDGVINIYESDTKKVYHEVPSFKDYLKDYERLCYIVNFPAARSFSYSRLKALDQCYDMHIQLSGVQEVNVQKFIPHRDFDNVRKVDNHIHLSAAMTARMLLKFIREKAEKDADRIVMNKNGKDLTLTELFQSLNLHPYHLSLDSLNMQADGTIYQRFDRFNTKYNPFGATDLRTVFIKTDNMIKGEYMASITKQLVTSLEEEKHTCAEYRLSIYGRKRDEWAKLAHWFVENKLASTNVRYMIQIPRIYNVYKKTGSIDNLQQMLDNIFIPLFENTLNPESNKELYIFLNCVDGFDSVDDESIVDSGLDISPEFTPDKWNLKENPAYFYWMYFMYANLYSLNQFRKDHHMSIISFRPHCGEAGDTMHLASAYLVSESINHGINLQDNTPLQYLYFLEQIGLSVSPLSNNNLFVKLKNNPFYKFFKRGLKVTLSTDDPLILHHSNDPLLEEYYTAQQIWELGQCDLCEIARNSVLISGYEYPFKCYFSGPTYYLDGPDGNNLNLTNVPDIRLSFRDYILKRETEIVRKFSEYTVENEKSKDVEFLDDEIKKLQDRISTLEKKKASLQAK